MVPVRDARGFVRAALTVPYVATTYSAVPADTVLQAAIDASEVISERIRGSSQGFAR